MWFIDTLHSALENHNLCWNCRVFFVKYDGKDPRSRFEQERCQTNSRKRPKVPGNAGAGSVMLFVPAANTVFFFLAICSIVFPFGF